MIRTVRFAEAGQLFIVCCLGRARYSIDRQVETAR